MEEEPRSPSPRRRKGCLIALAIVGAVGLLCGAGIVAMGWQAWSSPQVQLGVRAAGAAMEMNQRALQAPGAQAIRDAGCRHAMVYAPALMERFVEELDVDGDRIVAPRSTLIVCATQTEPPSCEALAAAYAGALGDDAPPAVLIDVFVAAEAAPRCDGSFDRSGGRVRDATADEARFASVVRPRVF